MHPILLPRGSRIGIRYGVNGSLASANVRFWKGISISRLRAEVSLSERPSLPLHAGLHPRRIPSPRPKRWSFVELPGAAPGDVQSLARATFPRPFVLKPFRLPHLGCPP